LKLDELAVIQYVGKVYKMGANKTVISIPKEDWPKMEHLISKKIIVSVKETVRE